MPGDERSDQSGFAEQVMDPEDFNRTQRFKEIHDARRRVTDYVAEMEISPSLDKYRPEAAARLALLVQLYIIELEPLIAQSAVEEGQYVAEQAPHDSLRDFSKNASPRTDDDTMAPWLILSYFRGANRFYAEIGMDLDLKKENADAGFDYEDILQEGPPGEGDFPDIEGVSGD